jgi:predicted CXXCH cytochrome family protein
MYEGIGGKGVTGTPSIHAAVNVDCVACHEVETGKKANMVVYKATEKACTECHGPGSEETLKEWQDAINETLAEAKEELAKAQKAYDALPDGNPRKKEAAVPLERAKHNLVFVEKAHGVHNPGYALELLDKVSEDAAEVISIAGPSVAAEPGE